MPPIAPVPSAPTDRAAAVWPIACDLEALLFDPAPGIASALRRTLQDEGLSPALPTPDRLRQMPLAALLRQLLTTDAGVPDAARLNRAAQRYADHHARLAPCAAEPWPGARTLLQGMAAEPGLLLHALDACGRAAALLERHGLTPPALPPALGAGTPAWRQLVSDSRWPPSCWLLISDSPPALLQARRAGLSTLALAYGRSSTAALRLVQPDFVASDLREVECRLAQWAGCSPLCRARPLPCLC